MARTSDTIGNVVSILVVAIVGYVAIVYLGKLISQSQSMATIRSAGGGGGAAGSIPGGSNLGGMLAGLFGGKINDSQALTDALAQSDQQIADSISNDFIPYVPYTNPFDAAGISFPIDYTNGGGGGGGATGGFVDATPPDTGGDGLDPSITTYF